MSSTKNPEEFANNLEAIMGANQDMLNDVLADLLLVDEAMKTSQTPADLALDIFIAELAHS